MPGQDTEWKYYSEGLLQKVLDMLWKVANKDGYVLAAPLIVLEGRRKTIFDGNADIVLNLVDLNQIYKILNELGVVELHSYQTSNSQGHPAICKVIAKTIDTDKYAELYQGSETVALRKQVDELKARLAEAEAQLQQRTNAASNDMSASDNGPGSDELEEELDAKVRAADDASG